MLMFAWTPHLRACANQGPADSPYAGGVFVLAFRIPSQYPLVPPEVQAKHGCCAGHVQSNAVVVAIVVMTMRSTRLRRARTGPLHDELLSSQCALQVR